MYYFSIFLVSFHQRSGNWPNPQMQPGNPPWHQFSTPRKRSSDSMPNNYYNGPSPLYNTPNQYSYNPGFSPGPELTPRIYQVPGYESRSSADFIVSQQDANGGRLLSDTAFSKISETLGAINTVGHYLVDYVNENEKNETDPNFKQLPQAIYTISKNVLGRNVTDTIAPFVKKALPRVLPEAPLTKIATGEVNKQEDNAKSCTTPEGKAGICEDLSNCPQLLLNLAGLRESLCFKDLFVPGVCCPADAVVSTPVAEAPVLSTTSKPTFLVPVTTQRPTTQRTTTTRKSSVIQVLTTKRPRVTTARPKTTTAAYISGATNSRPVPSLTFTTVPPPILTNYSNIVDINGNYLCFHIGT